MLFAQARDSEFPPYLLDFRGSPGERHVENLKVCIPTPLAWNFFMHVYADLERCWYSSIQQSCRTGIGPGKWIVRALGRSNFEPFRRA